MKQPTITIILSNLVALMNAQQQNCFPLTGTTMCPSHEGLNVKAMDGSFSDVASFDQFITNSLSSSQSYMSDFITFYDCPQWVGNFERFHQSTLCAFLIQKSGCEEPQPVQPLCQESCQSFIDSSSKIFSNATACNPNPSPEVLQNRNNLVADSNNQFAAFCAESPSSAQDPTCMIGETGEAEMCGFISAEDAMAMCTGEMANDPCCPNFVNGALTEAAEGLAPPNNTFVIVGVAVGVVGFLVVLFFLYIWGKKWNKQTTQAAPFQEKKMSVFGNIATGARLSIANSRKSFAGGRRSTVAPDMPPPMMKDSDPYVPDKSQFASMYTIPGVNSMSPSKFKKVPRQTQNMQEEAPPLPVLNHESMYSNGQRQTAVTDASTRLVVIDTYDKAADDEIDLNVDDIIVAEECFDDGWAYGRNLTTGESGVFPLACVLVLGGDRQSQASRGPPGKRVSSYNPTRFRMPS